MGRTQDVAHIRTWQMQPLGAAMLKAVTPKDWDFVFYDDRLEKIPYDQPTDLVGISVETYTAKRAYQIASEYRRRGVPVIMGGFHATLCSEEVAEYADSVCIGQGEGVWSTILKDFREGNLKKIYHGGKPDIDGIIPDRSIFEGKRYLPIALVETGRGCTFNCEFCAVQRFYNNTRVQRSLEDIKAELDNIKEKFIFFVDDNMLGNKSRSIELLEYLSTKNFRWLTQTSINTAWDEDMLALMKKAGCNGVLIGLESFNQDNLRLMNKGVNLQNIDYGSAVEQFRKYGIWVYATFLLGYDHDKESDYQEYIEFADKHRLGLCGFNHITPFPGTPLYDRLKKDGRLRFDKWWLDDKYRYDMIPYVPLAVSSSLVEETCLKLRKRFYGLRSLLWRSLDFKANIKDFTSFSIYWATGLSMFRDVRKRDMLVLGDTSQDKELLKVK